MDNLNGPQNGSYMSSSRLHQKTEEDPKAYPVCPQSPRLLLKCLWGLSAQTHRHIRPHGNFIQNGVPKGGHYRKGGYSYILMTYDPVPWCLFPFPCVFSKRNLSICPCNQLLYIRPCSLS